MNPLVISVAFNDYRDTFSEFLHSHMEYAKRHGYDYFLKTGRDAVSMDDACWARVPLLIDALKAGRSMVAYFDADCDVRPSTPPLESVLVDGKSIYMAKGFSGRFNSGVIIMKSDPIAVGFLETVFDTRHTPVPRQYSAPAENGHFIYHARDNEAVAELDPAWNNNRDLDPTSYVQHYSANNRAHWRDNSTS